MVLGTVIITNLDSVFFYLILIDARIKIEIEGEHVTGSEAGRSDSINLTVPLIFPLRPVADLHLTICRKIQSITAHFFQLNFSPTCKVQALTVQEIYFSVECFWMDRQDFSDSAQRNAINEKLEELFVRFGSSMDAVSFLGCKCLPAGEALIALRA